VAGAADLAFGLATSVGPVPFSSADEAVDFVLRTHPRFPTVPVTVEPGASLLAQSVFGLDGIELVEDGASLSLEGPLVSPGAAAEAAGRLEPTGPLLADTDVPAVDAAPFGAITAFGRAYGSRLVCARSAGKNGPAGSGPLAAAIRLPVLGPVTLSCHLRAAGVSGDDADAVAAAATAARSVAALRELHSAVDDGTTGARPTAPGSRSPIAVVLSEPALVGSMHPTHPVLPGQVRTMLDPVIDALDMASGVDPLLIGVHVPGQCDWPTVVGSGVSYLSVPVDRAVSGWAALFGDLLERGGRICWGAVPVDRPIGTSEAPHWRRLLGLWTALVADGVDPMLLRLRSTFAPADGLARFDPDSAEMVMDLTAAVAERVGHQAVAARLALGA